MYSRRLQTLALATALSAPALLLSSCKDEIARPPRASAELTFDLQRRQSRALDRLPQLARDVNEVRIDLSRHELPPLLDDNALVDSVRKVDGIVMIGFKPSGSPPTRETGVFHAMAQSVALAARHAIEARGATLLSTMRSSSMIVARIPPELAPELRRLPFVNYLEPNGVGAVAQAPLIPQDTGWGVRKVHADWVWNNLYITGHGAVITIIDTGVDSTHFYDYERDGPEGLFGDCLYVEGVATTCFQGPAVHGSHVAGIVSARDNAYGVIGIAYNPVRFAAIRACTDDADCPTWAVAGALDWTATNGYSHQIVNMSLQYCQGSNGLSEAVARSAAAGNLLVSAAGNTSHGLCGPPVWSGVTFPGRYPEVIAVSGTLTDDQFADPTPAAAEGCPTGSRYGPQVSLSAPFWAKSMVANGGWGVICGTSMAAPVVSGVAALLWTQNPGWTATDVRDRLEATAEVLYPTIKYGHGRVNAFSALYVPPPPPLSVGISGPNPVQPYSGCLFTATVTDGTEPYSYAWTADGSPVGENSPTYRHYAGASAFQLGVAVTDAQGKIGYGLFAVSVDAWAQPCLDQ